MLDGTAGIVAMLAFLQQRTLSMHIAPFSKWVYKCHVRMNDN